MIRTDWIERWALYSPQKIACVDDQTQKTFTYAAVNDITWKMAELLAGEFAVGSGDRVAVLSQNCIEYVFLFLALQRLGAVLVPVNYRLAPPEIHFVLTDSQPKLVLVQEEYAGIVAGHAGGTARYAKVPLRRSDGNGLWDRAMKAPTPARGEAPRWPFSTPCMILYSSGTTGRPKGAIITHGMIFWNSVNTSMRLNLTSDDVTLTFAPFFHTGGWHVLTTPFLHRGATIVFLNSFQPDRVVELCDTAGVTVLFGVPTMMKMMSETPQFTRASFKTVRYAIVGGEPMPIPQIELWQSRGVPVRQGFGLTEVGPNCFSLPEEDALRKKGSIGYPNFYIDTRIVDDAGRDVGADQPGELLLRSPVVTPGYWNNPAATAETIIDGWFHTGDIVRRDRDGYFFVVDRKKDMFISGAENVYPAEIEAVLYTHPAIAEVAVIGVPDDQWGEVGKAFVVLRQEVPAGIHELREYCRDRLAKYKVPKHWEILPTLPKGHSGKILKRSLKEVSSHPSIPKEKP
jgi:fatty-acyl-CoA synthase